jgi:hypothetical protein
VPIKASTLDASKMASSQVSSWAIEVGLAIARGLSGAQQGLKSGDLG